MPITKTNNPLLERPNAANDPAVALADITAPTTFQGPTKKRNLRKAFNRQSAAEAIGTLKPSVSLFVFSKGQFSLIDAIEHIIEQTGPVHLSCSTWTAADADLSQVEQFVQQGKLTGARFLVDFSFQRRSPAILNQLRQRFGADSLRVTRTHAKFVLLENENWKLTIKTSMNLNNNPRLEHLEITDDPGLFQFLNDFVGDIFRRRPSTDSQQESAAWHKKQFQQLS